MLEDCKNVNDCVVKIIEQAIYPRCILTYGVWCMVCDSLRDSFKGR